MKKYLFSFALIIISATTFAATLTVDSLNNAGTGSLRQAVIDANDGDTIRFNTSLLGDTITLLSEIAFNKGLTFKGLYNATDTLYISGGNTNRIFNVDLSSATTKNMVLDSMVLINGNASGGDGGAVSLTNGDSLFIQNTVVHGNSANNGGGIYSYSSSSVTVTNSTISGNTARDNGGGISSSSSSSSSVTVSNSTISGNSATSNGGGIYSYSYGSSSSVTVSNSTISGNTAGDNGGGIYSFADDFSSSSVTVTNSTISGNSATTNGGGIYSYSPFSSSSSVTIGSSIVALNGAYNIYNFGFPSNYTSNGYNIFSGDFNGNAVANDQTNVDSATLNLQPLAFNGGTTQTMLPGTGSVAINMGNPTDFTDAQNAPVIDSRRDVGAAEGKCLFDSTFATTVCNSSYTSPSGNYTWTTTGTYQDTVYGTCDTAYTINLTLTPVPYDTVINTNNSGCGSLRDVVSRVADGDTVYFDPALIASGSDTITLTSEIAFNKGLTFKGLYNATDTLYISGNNTNRIFNVDLASATVKNITMDSMVFIDGYIAGNGGALAFDYVDTLFFTNGAVMNSQATDNGAGIYFANGNAVEIDNTSIKNNTASSNGGGIYSYSYSSSSSSPSSSVTVTNSTISGNSATNDGGGIYSYSSSNSSPFSSSSSVTVTGSTISGNSATNDGGGIYSYSYSSLSSSSSVTVTNSTISGNSATNDGGGIYSYSSADYYYYYYYSSSSSVTVTGSTISGNAATNDGGGIYSYSIADAYSSSSSPSSSSSSVTVTNSTISGNTAGNNGGGINSYSYSYSSYSPSLSSSSSVTVTGSTISGNSATNDGGGIYSYSNIESSSSSVTVTNSTISGNTAGNNGGGILSYSGGFSSSSSVTVTNSTISGNTAGNNGGGINSYSYSYFSSSSVTVTNSTISGNSATNDGGGISSYSSSSSSSSSSSVTIGSSIVALNGSSNIYSNPGDSITSQGYNIFSDASLSGSVATDQMGIDSASLNLLPLAFNGGTTQTMLPGSGSVAINMGNPTDFTDAQNDTIYNGRRDVGAAESPRCLFDSTFATTVCNSSYTSPSGNHTWTTTGTYQDTVYGTCDTAYTINLTLTPVPYDTVINTNNSGCGSLRDVVSRVADGDTVYFDPALIASGSDTITLLSEIAFNKGLTFKGLYNATDTLYISGNNTNRIFYANLSSATVKNITMDSMVFIDGYISGNGGALAFDYVDTLFFTNSAVMNSQATGSGGGIYFGNGNTVEIDNASIKNNTASKGGGIYSSSSFSSSVTVTNSTISGNTAGYNGGGISSYSSTFSYSSSVTVNYSTISGNTAGNYGGGISSYSYSDYSSSSVTVNYSTISGNTAGNDGGGIYSESYYSFSSSSSVTVSNSTISGNSATNDGGGIYSSSSSSSVTIGSSIVALNGSSNIYSSPGYFITSQGYNIFSNASLSGSVSTDQMDIDSASLNLLPLAFNGGTTQTMLPGSGSVAINMGNPTDFTAAQNDTIYNGRRDVGAAESPRCLFDSTFATTVCNSSYTSPSGNHTWTTTGTYQDTVYGTCDTAYTINLTLTPVPYDTVINTNNSGCGSLRDVVNRVADGDTVYFDPALIASGSDTITLTSEIAFNKGLTFKGLYNATDTLYISGNNTNRIFNVDLASASIKHMVLDSMVLINGNAQGSGTAGEGGAVRFVNGDSLTINNSILRNNHSDGYGGAVHTYTASYIKLISNNSSYINNTANNSGGAIAVRSQTSGGIGTSNLIMNNCIVASNSVSSSNNVRGGGIYINGAATETTIENCAIIDNTITSATNASGGGISPLSSSSSSVTVNNSTISGNTAGSQGGGISSSSSSSSSVTVNNSTISGNTAGVQGGGIYSDALLSSSVTVNYSTITGNTAGSDGGGIYSYSSSPSSSSVTVSNSTISGNTAGYNGGGIYFYSYSFSSSVTIGSSIVALNGTNNIYNSSSSSTNYTTNGYNIFSGTFNGNAGANDQTNVTATQLNLQPLALNGGPTQTMLPGAGSVAINMGNPTDFTDAQNAPIIDSRRDVGAAEGKCTIMTTDTLMTCDSLTWINGTTYYADTLGDTYTYDLGTCDSVVTLNLTINAFEDTIKLDSIKHVSCVGLNDGYLEVASNYTVVAANYIYISEINVNSPDYIELTTVGTVDVSDLEVVISDDYSNISLYNSITWDLGTGTYTDTVVYRQDDFSMNNYWGNNIYWYYSDKSWAFIGNKVTGEIVDAAFWGWDSTSIANFSINVNGTTYSNASSLAWVGDGEEVYCSESYFRTSLQGGSKDSWECNTKDATFGINSNILNNVIDAPIKYLWSNGDTTIYTDSLSAGNYTLTVTDTITGCTKDTMFTINELPDVTSPTVMCQDTTIYLDATGNISLDTTFINNGSTDNCSIDTMYLSAYDFTCVQAGEDTIVKLYVEDASGNIDSCEATVSIKDTLAPTATCQNYTAYLDASGNASIDTNNINNGSTDNCAIDTMYLSQYDFTCANTGTNNVWLYVKDASGNIDSCQAVVTVQDTVAPTAQCQAYTAYLDASGNVSIDTNNINNGSTDNCAIDTMYLSQYNFTCANVGVNTVTLTVEDVNGNSSTCTATVTIQDTVAPTAQCQPFTTQLSTSGLAVVTPQDIDDGSYDNCASIDTMYLSQDTFTCADYGLNNITLYVQDSYGNIDSCATYIDIQDNTAPEAICQDTTIYLDATGMTSLTAADVDGGSWDSCGINSISIDKTNFTCADLGANTVTLSVSDNKGNTGTCTATVTVLDTLAPTVMCQNATVQLDVFGQASITTTNIDNGTTDNCSTPTLSLSQTTFDCSNLGSNTVTLYATDASGNTDSCTATVTVEDNLMPTVVCKNISVQLSTAGTASIVPADVINSMSDNCGIDTAFIDTYNFTCTDIGANYILVTVRDSAGNTATCTATVTVQGDNTTPQVTCTNTTVYLDAAGQASVTNADLTASATAVCGIADTTLSQYNFTCNDIGTNNVTVTLTDQNGKAGMCTAQVTVLDTFTTTVLPYSNACAGSTISITAQAGRAGALVTWYSDAAGNNILATGNPYTTAPLTASTSIWVNETYGNGCASPLVEVPITVVNGTQPSVASNSPVCYGDNIELTADGGYVIYNWYGPNGYTSNDQNPTIANATSAASGTYYLVVQSLNGCVSDSAITTVTVNPEVVLSTALDASYTFCEDGQVEVTATLGANQSGAWTGPNGFTSNSATISIAVANEAQHEGVYSLTVTDNSTGCSSTAVYETFIDIVPRPVLSTITGGNTTVCPGESFTLEASNVAGASYTWTLPDGTTSNDNPLSVATATQDHAGTYTVYANQGSCVSDTITTTMNVYPQPNIAIEAENDTFTQGDVIRLLATGGVSYLWTPYDYINNPNSAEIFISEAPHGDYTYQVTAFDVNACLDSADYSFTILPNEVLEINNVITPNGDGKNDVWVIDFLENVDVYTIRILSRNGAEVYRAENPYNNDWGGISDEGKELPSGAYFYIIDTKDKVYTGGLTIVK